MAAPGGNGTWTNATTFAPDLYPGETILAAVWASSGIAVTHTATTLTFTLPILAPANQFNPYGNDCVRLNTDQRTCFDVRVL